MFVLSNLLFAGRYYDAATGRFLQVDPLASKYPSLSPYNYCANSPLIFIDPDGKKIIYHRNQNNVQPIINNLNSMNSSYIKSIMSYANSENSSIHMNSISRDVQAGRQVEYWDNNKTNASLGTMNHVGRSFVLEYYYSSRPNAAGLTIPENGNPKNNFDVILSERDVQTNQEQNGILSMNGLMTLDELAHTFYSNQGISSGKEQHALFYSSLVEGFNNGTMKFGEGVMDQVIQRVSLFTGTNYYYDDEHNQILIQD